MLHLTFAREILRHITHYMSSEAAQGSAWLPLEESVNGSSPF
jgi:hypothetical protein